MSVSFPKESILSPELESYLAVLKEIADSLKGILHVPESGKEG